MADASAVAAALSAEYDREHGHGEEDSDSPDRPARRVQPTRRATATAAAGGAAAHATNGGIGTGGTRTLRSGRVGGGASAFAGGSKRNAPYELPRWAKQFQHD